MLPGAFARACVPVACLLRAELHRSRQWWHRRSATARDASMAAAIRLPSRGRATPFLQQLLLGFAHATGGPPREASQDSEAEASLASYPQLLPQHLVETWSEARQRACVCRCVLASAPTFFASSWHRLASESLQSEASQLQLTTESLPTRAPAKLRGRRRRPPAAKLKAANRFSSMQTLLPQSAGRRVRAMTTPPGRSPAKPLLSSPCGRLQLWRVGAVRPGGRRAWPKRADLGGRIAQPATSPAAGACAHAQDHLAIACHLGRTVLHGVQPWQCHQASQLHQQRHRVPHQLALATPKPVATAEAISAHTKPRPPGAAPAGRACRPPRCECSVRQWAPSCMSCLHLPNRLCKGRRQHRWRRPWLHIRHRPLPMEPTPRRQPGSLGAPA
mmetsp:Transcript_72364/g.172426  ORF Transcript_72364/g.172426 Transcript_72364/m.172426 type:complete len:388 (-) Transcript_72364:358-1521(-)